MAHELNITVEPEGESEEAAPVDLGTVAVTLTPEAEISVDVADGADDADKALSNLTRLREAVPETPGVEAHRVPGPEGDSYREALDDVLDNFGTERDFAALIQDDGPETEVREQDFLDTAVVLAGPSGEAPMARKLQNIHRLIGRPPFQILEDSRADPLLRDELLSDRTPFPQAYGGPDLPEPKEGGPGSGIRASGMPSDPPGELLEEPGLVSRALDDIGEFISSPIEIASALVGGSLNKLDDIMETVGLNTLTREVDAAIRPFVGDTLANILTVSVPPLPPTETGTGEVVAELAGFATAAVPAAKGAQALAGAGALVSWIFGAMVSGFTRSPELDEEGNRIDPTLADVLGEVGPVEADVAELLENFLTPSVALPIAEQIENLRAGYAEALETKEGDDEFELRLNSMTEEGVLELAGFGALKALVGLYKLSKAGVQALKDPAVKQLIKDLAVETGGSVPITKRHAVQNRARRARIARTVVPTGAKGRRTVRDVAKALDDDHLAQHGRQLNPSNPEDFQLAVSNAAAEIRFQLRQDVTGANWYDADVNEAYEELSKISGLETLRDKETHRVIWSAFAGATSNGNRVTPNTLISSAIMREYVKRGTRGIPTVQPQAGGSIGGVKGTGFGPKGPSIAAGLRIIKHLIETKGEEGFADWWLSTHSKAELTAVRRAAGLVGPPNFPGKAGDRFLGSMVLGDKTGRFSLAINGFDETTKDRWFVRYFNRHFGQIGRSSVDPSTAGAKTAMLDETGVFDQPRNGTERLRQAEFSAAVADATGLNLRDAQAVPWFFEQNLYTDLGVKSVPGSFSDASRKAAERIGVGRPGGVRPGNAAQAEGLEGFRSISPPKRSARDLRRSLGAGTGSGNPGSLSRAYSSETGRIHERGVVHAIDEQAGLDLNAAGLSTPDVIELTPSRKSAGDFKRAIQAARKSNKSGAQVEVKSVGDYEQARLYLTDDGNAGFAIMPDGDIVSVFNAGGSPHKKVSYGLIQLAVEQGGIKLDAFDTYLTEIYAAVGFKPVGRVAWDDQFAPKGWDKKRMAEFPSTFTDNPGEPDLVTMVYDPLHFDGAAGGTKFKSADEAFAAQERAAATSEDIP